MKTYLITLVNNNMSHTDYTIINLEYVKDINLLQTNNIYII